MWLIVSGAAIGNKSFLEFSRSVYCSSLHRPSLFLFSPIKENVFHRNVLIGSMTGMAFIYGGVVVGRIEHAVVPAIFAFLVNLARELLKDVEDMEGDRRENAVTLPVKYGVTTALILRLLRSLILIVSR